MFPGLRFGHEIRLCFAVADASQSHAAYAWQTRWPQNWKVKFIRFQKWRLGFICDVLGTKLGAVLPLRMRHKATQLMLGRLAGDKTESQVYSKVSEVTLGPFLVFFCYVLGTKLNAFRCCGCVTKRCNLCLASSMATKLKSQVYSKVSEVTLGPFWCSFARFLGTKLGAVLPLRMRHNVMQLVLGRLAGNKTEKY